MKTSGYLLYASESWTGLGRIRQELEMKYRITLDIAHGDHIAKNAVYDIVSKEKMSVGRRHINNREEQFEME